MKKDGRLSRRRWMGQVTMPALAASVVPGLAGGAETDEVASDDPGADAASSVDALRGARVHNVRDYGAKGDGAALDTGAVQAAIDACHANDGGTVLVPAGTFVVGTLE